jgi:hypothetical protein
MSPLSSVFRRPRALGFALLTLGVVAATGFSPIQAQVSSVVASGSVRQGALPSGLSPVAELAVGGVQLALDSNGTLYRSDDQGKRWRPIKQQWDGKAVELLGIPALTSAPKSGQAPRSVSDQEIFAAVLLKSTTALHWVSVDRGKTWTPSTLDDVRRNDIKWSAEVAEKSMPDEP